MVPPLCSQGQYLWKHPCCPNIWVIYQHCTLKISIIYTHTHTHTNYFTYLYILYMSAQEHAPSTTRAIQTLGDALLPHQICMLVLHNVVLLCCIFVFTLFLLELLLPCFNVLSLFLLLPVACSHHHH